MIRALSPRELVGVLAHEFSHIRHQDTRVMGVADVVARITGSLSQIGQVLLLLQIPAVLMGKSVGLSFLQILALVFAPLATNLLQLALSRQREFHADAGAIELTGDPEGLASALRKLEQHHGGNWLQKLLFPQRRAPDPAILRTHPAMEERIERLRDLIDRPPQVAPPANSSIDRDESPPALHRIVLLPYRLTPSRRESAKRDVESRCRSMHSPAGAGRNGLSSSNLPAPPAGRRAIYWNLPAAFCDKGA